MFKYSYLCFFLILSLVFISCKEDDPVAPVIEQGTAQVTGQVKFLDNTPGPWAVINLKSTSYGTVVTDTCDEQGLFRFTGVSKGEYYLNFVSTAPDMNSANYLVNVDSSNQVVNKDVVITYKQLDDFKVYVKSTDIFFMQVQPHGAHIGTRFDKVDYFSGFFRRDYLNKYTLTCEVYKIPEGVNWTKSVYTVDSIRTTFEFLTEIIEEPVKDNTHEMRIKGDAIPILLSDPPNGFAFIKKYNDDKELAVPCMDFVNNDFGFVIKYK